MDFFLLIHLIEAGTRKNSPNTQASAYLFSNMSVPALISEEEMEIPKTLVEQIFKDCSRDM